MTARRLGALPDPVADEPSEIILRAAVLASVRAPSLVRTLGVQPANGALWLVSELDDGVWLDRLLELTRPRPAHAVVVGLGVLSGLQAVHAAGHAHGAVSAAEVRVGADGQARLDGWAAGTLGGSGAPEQRQRADITAVGGLLADLARAARRSSGSDRNAPALLAALDAAAGCAAHAGADAELVAAPLEAACGPDDDRAARSELAAVVRVVTANSAVSRSGSAPSPASSSAPPSAPSDADVDAAPGVAPADGQSGAESDTATRAESGAAPAPTATASRFPGLGRRIRTWAVALLVLVAVVALEYVLLHERIAEDLRRLQGTADRPERSTVGPAELPPVASPAPAAAGLVSGVDLRALQPCTPGAVCTVRVLVQLQHQQAIRQPAPRTVGWSFQVVDRCTGVTRTAPGGVVSTAPGGDRIQAVSRLPLPPGQALVVFAVASEPAVTGGSEREPVRAASAPLPVPTRPTAC